MALKHREQATGVLSEPESSEPLLGAMSVTLISPSPDPHYIFAYGVRILSACLKQIGCRVNVIFLPRVIGDLYSDRILEQIVQLSAHSSLIGVSLMTDDFENAVRITQKLKLSLTAPIVWGGVHPTLQPTQCSEHADIVCLGEAEETLVELAQKMRSGEGYHHVEGTWQKSKGTLITNPLRLPVRDLDRLPFPDYDYQEHSILIGDQIVPLTHEVLEDRLRERYLTLTSRGCPFKCNYCFNHSYHRLFPGSPTIRKRSIDNVIRELTIVQERFPSIDQICIADDALLLRSNEDIEDFGRKYKANIRIPMWVTGANPSTITARKLAALADGGMNVIRMGLQTASPRTLKLYSRNESNQQAKAAVQLLNTFRDKIKTVQLDILVDNPWEVASDVRATLLFLCRLPVPFELFLFPLVFYPGTDLYDKAVEAGLIPKEQNEKQRARNHQVKSTYLNSVLVLLNERVRSCRRIPLPLMLLLTEPVLIRLRISQFMYWIFKSRTDGRLVAGMKEMISYKVREAFSKDATVKCNRDRNSGDFDPRLRATE
jgi:radical SAM superfamily enzyme YgiQ (UPF0313 family)